MVIYHIVFASCLLANLYYLNIDFGSIIGLRLLLPESLEV